MSPGDIVMWHDKQFGKHCFWRIEGVYLGCEGQESLVELRNLTEKPGVPGRTGQAETTFVPEPLLRDVAIYTPDITIGRLRTALEEIAVLKGEDLYVADGCGFDNLAAMKARAALDDAAKGNDQ